MAVLLLLGCAPLPVRGQSVPAESERISQIRQLIAAEQWAEAVRVAESASSSSRSAEVEYDYGTALAQLGRWDDARRAFLAGRRLQPRDKRFPIELAGVDFKQKHYARATAWLRVALRLDPGDAYANDFLGTVYFLQNNLDAALKYWNRAGKPQIENIRLGPVPRVNPALLDRAFAFSPASTLSLPELLTARSRVDGLGIFTSYAFDLIGRDDGKFDVAFRARERNGWGSSKWAGALSFFRGIFYQTVYPEYFNAGRSAVNVVSLVRWDAQKRRALASLSGPLRQDPKWRYRLGLDLRNENWDIRDSSGLALQLGALNLRREAVSAGIASFNSGRWGWSSGVELSRRDYRSVLAGSALTPEMLLQGYQLKHLALLDYEVLRVPERRLDTRATIVSQLGRVWSQPTQSFAKLQSSIVVRWFPRSQGDDCQMQARVGGGKTFGQVPFDELFMLGLERDNDLWLRAHIGTRDGRKGSAPLGRNYFLSNWEIDKNLYSNGLLTLKLGPFLDSGKITDPSPGLGSKQWLWDTGMQFKARVLGVGLVFTYGKDLRTGRNVFYAAARR